MGIREVGAVGQPDSSWGKGRRVPAWGKVSWRGTGRQCVPDVAKVGGGRWLSSPSSPWQDASHTAHSWSRSRTVAVAGHRVLWWGAGVGLGGWFVLFSPTAVPGVLEHHSQTGRSMLGSRAPCRGHGLSLSKLGRCVHRGVEAGRGSELCPGTWVAGPKGGS